MATSGGDMKDSPNLDPPDDWELNYFLLEVSDMLEEDDLQKMKSLCSGKGGFGKGVLERLTTPLQFFDLLRHTERLTRYNLLFLQTLIWSVGRKDIHKKFVEFGRENKEALHFFAPKETPENGYKYIKFHIGGDTQNYSLKALRDLHGHVARLLRVPANFVFIRGIEPSTSLLITFMVPEDVVYVMLELTEDERKGLVQYNIDNILAEDKNISLEGETPLESFLHEALESKKLLEKELRQEKEIESLQIKLIEANKVISKCKNLHSKQADWWLSWLSFIYNLHCATARFKKSQKVPTCKMLAAQLIQRRMLRRSRELKYDATIINQLMDANSTIVIEHIKTNEDLSTIVLLHFVRSLQNENCVLQYQLDKLMFYCRIKEDDRIMSERDEFFLSQVFQGHPIGIDVKIGREVVEKLDGAFVIHVLQILSKEMTTNERKKVINNSRLTSEERSYIKQYPEQLLAVVFSKEPQTAAGIDIFIWLQKILHPLGNQNLLRMAFDMITSRNRPVGPDLKIPKGGDGTGSRARDGMGTTREKGSSDRLSAKAGSNGVESPERDEELKKKMEKMEHMLSSIQKDIDLIKVKTSPYSPLFFLNRERKWPDELRLNRGIFPTPNDWNYGKHEQFCQRD